MDHVRPRSLSSYTLMSRAPTHYHPLTQSRSTLVTASPPPFYPHKSLQPLAALGCLLRCTPHPIYLPVPDQGTGSWSLGGAWL